MLTRVSSALLPSGYDFNLCLQGLRVEWCKARARAHRYREDLELVDEEMRRAIEFTKWRAEWWLKQTERENVSGELVDGLRAYAKEQSAIEVERAQVWEAEWLPVRVRARGVLAYLNGESEIPSGSLDIELEDDDDEFELNVD